MTTSPGAVNYVIPLMKNLHMSWIDIKSTPTVELEGLVLALGEYNILHQFDGYSAKEIGDMAKNKPEIRTQYNEYIARRRKYGYDKSQNSFSSFSDVKRD